MQLDMLGREQSPASSAQLFQACATFDSCQPPCRFQLKGKDSFRACATFPQGGEYEQDMVIR